MSSSTSTTTPKKKTNTLSFPSSSGAVCFDASQVVGEYPNKIVRRRLAAEWASLSPQRRSELRAARSLRGICCDVCGLNGFYREICPNECVSPPGTPDSLDSTPPATPPEKKAEKSSKSAKSRPKSTKGKASGAKGREIESEENSTAVSVFWGDSKDLSLVADGNKDKRANNSLSANATAGQSSYQIKRRPDLSTLRPQAQQRLTELRESDASLSSQFAFFSQAELSYARSYAELSLQQLMRRMMRLLEQQLLKNSDELSAGFDATLLHPPAEKIRSTFYPTDLLDEKDLREYFYGKEKEEKKKAPRNYQFQGNLRPVDELDSLFRGGEGGAAHDESAFYHVKKNAGASIHSKNTWKSTLAKHDALADSDPTMARKQQALDKLFDNQSQWISLQKEHMKQRNDRFEHIVHLLRTEIHREHQRETDLLLADNKRVSKDAAMKIFQDRLRAVDLMARVLKSYKFTAGLEEADLLLFSLRRWEEETTQRMEEDLQRREVDPNIERKRLSLTYGEYAKTKKKDKSTKLSSQTGKSAGQRDLVAADTHPYFQDLQFLDKMNKKKERLLLAHHSQPLSQSKEREIDGAMLPTKIPKKTTLLHDDKGESGNDGSEHNDIEQRTDHTNDSVVSLQQAQDGTSVKFLDDTNAVVAGIPANKAVQNTKPPKKKAHKVQRKKHPREIDAENIAALETSFRRAGLGNRIRKGDDNDYAHALPALISIPKAFDGNSQVPSYAGQNIIFRLKKEMVLSDIGYTKQHAVPLYVRNSLVEKEGTSANGDPTQEELAGDRRYSHYLGRPFVRFTSPNKNTKEEPPLQSTLLGNGSAESPPKSTLSMNNKTTSLPPLPNDLSALSDYVLPSKHQKRFKTLVKTETGEYKALEDMNEDLQRGSTAGNGGLNAEERRTSRKEKRLAKTLPISRSLVRMVFKTEPNLEDLKYLND